MDKNIGLLNSNRSNPTVLQGAESEMDPVNSTLDKDRSIRIFISSTFVDMQAERDELGRFIFPLLRKVCEQRDVSLVDIDFRWGITDDKSEEQVLKICLEKLGECNIFIGLLGERYGTIAKEISPNLMESEPWLADHREDSFTELEILKGVLNIPRLAEHSFFYFRDPVYINTLPEDQQSIFREKIFPEVTEGGKSLEKTGQVQTPSRKLSSLKDRIRASGIVIRENYHDPRQLGEWVQCDLTNVIDHLYPQDSLPDMLDREIANQKKVISRLTKIFVTNSSYYDVLNSYADGQEGLPIILLGESGMGKSALLANWGKEYCKAHPDEYLLHHIVGTTMHSDPLSGMLYRILGELRRQFDLPENMPNSPGDLRAVFPRWLHLACLRGKIVLILDGIDRISTLTGIPDLSWLPYGLPVNIRLILSVRGSQLPGEYIKRNYASLIINPLDVSERERLVNTFLELFSKALKTDQVRNIGKYPQCGLPLYLRILLEELRLCGSHAGLTNRLETYLHAQTAEQLCSLVLDRLELDYDRDNKGLVREAVSLLLSARQGLKEPELLELLGYDGNPLPYAHWVHLSVALEPYLQDLNGSLVIPDGYFRLAARNKYLTSPELERSLHAKLGRYFSKQNLSPRKLVELPWQLAQAEEWQVLYNLLHDQHFLQAAWANDRNDVCIFWSQVELHSPLRMVYAFKDLDFPPLDNATHNSQVDDLHWIVATLLFEAKKFEQAIPVYKIRADYFEKKKDIPQLVNTLNNLGLCYMGLGRFDLALPVFQKQQELCFSINDGTGFSSSIINHAYILDQQGAHTEALSMYRKVEELCRLNGDEYGLQVVIGNLAGILIMQGDLSKASQLLEERDQVCRKLGDWNSLLANFLARADVVEKSGRTADALNLLQEYENYYRQSGNPGLLQKGLVQRSSLLHKHGDLKSAFDLLDEAESICTQIEYRKDYQEILGKKALIFLDQNATLIALGLLKEQEQLIREIGDETCLQACLGVQASAYSQVGDQDTALALLKEQERLCRKNSHLDGLQRSLGDQANIFFQQHDLADSLALHKEEESICRQLGNLEAIQKMLGNKGVVLLALGKHQQAMEIFKERKRSVGS